MKFDTSRFIFIVKGLLVGAAVGIVVSLFRLLIEKFLVFIKFLFMQAHNNSIYFIIIAIKNRFLYPKPSITNPPNKGAIALPALPNELTNPRYLPLTSFGVS